MTVTAAIREVESTRKASFTVPPPGFRGLPDALSGLVDEGIKAREATDRFVAALNGDLPRPSESPALRQIRDLQERLGTGMAAGLG